MSVREHNKRRVAAMLWDLHLGGPIEDDSGRAVSVWRQRCAARGIPIDGPISSLLKMLRGKTETSIESVRYTKATGTRVYGIELVLEPHQLPANPYEEFDGPDDPEDPESEEDSGEDLLPPAAIDFDIFDRLLVAQRLISDAVVDAVRFKADLAAYANNSGEVIAQRLADALEENARLRRKLAEAAETSVAHIREVDALRKANARLNANLDAVTRQERIGDGTGFRGIDLLMREIPRNR